ASMAPGRYLSSGVVMALCSRWTVGMSDRRSPTGDCHGSAGVCVAQLDFALQVSDERFDDTGAEACLGCIASRGHADAVVSDRKGPVAVRGAIVDHDRACRLIGESVLE